VADLGDDGKNVQLREEEGVRLDLVSHGSDVLNDDSCGVVYRIGVAGHARDNCDGHLVGLLVTLHSLDGVTRFAVRSESSILPASAIEVREAVVSSSIVDKVERGLVASLKLDRASTRGNFRSNSNREFVVKDIIHRVQTSPELNRLAVFLIKPGFCFG